MKKVCSIVGCGKPVRGKGWCFSHWYRNHTHGDPLAGRTAPGTPEKFLNEVVLKYSGDVCLTWPFARSSAGYGKLFRSGKSDLVSRIVCEIVHGPAPTEESVARHLCGKGHEACCSPGHLVWGTVAQNSQDMVWHGTSARGQRNPSAKLSPAHVVEIRRLAHSMPRIEIAAQFGISAGHVWDIAKGNRWGWLP